MPRRGLKTGWPARYHCRKNFGLPAGGGGGDVEPPAGLSALARSKPDLPGWLVDSRLAVFMACGPLMRTPMALEPLATTKMIKPLMTKYTVRDSRLAPYPKTTAPNMKLTISPV